MGGKIGGRGKGRRDVRTDRGQKEGWRRRGWMEERMGCGRMRQGRVEEWQEEGKRGWEEGRVDGKHILWVRKACDQ